MPLVPFFAGQDATSTTLNAAFDIIQTAYQGADSTPVNNSVVLAASTYLTLPVAASGFYIYESMILYDTNATADFQHLIVLPVGGTNGNLSRLTANTASTLTYNADTSLSTASGGVASGTILACERTGLISIAGAVGNVSIQFSQNTATAVNTILKQGSWIRLTKVG
jgi:hypothetical protein